MVSPPRSSFAMKPTTTAIVTLFTLVALFSSASEHISIAKRGEGKHISVAKKGEGSLQPVLCYYWYILVGLGSVGVTCVRIGRSFPI